MITRFYVDNYKCLVNFEYKPKSMELIIGDNGSGKTTVFEALDKVRQFLNRKVDVSELFPRESRTRWINKSSQVFEVDFEDDNGKFEYRLEIENMSNVCFIERETLRWDGELFAESFWGEIGGLRSNAVESKLFGGRHDHETRYINIKMPKSQYPLSNPNETMLVIQNWNNIQNTVLLKLNPPLVINQIGRIDPRLSTTGSNFGSYYLYTLQQKQGQMFDVVSQLREVLPGFDSFSIEEDFEEGRRELNVNFKRIGDAKTISGAKFSFDELSDGQRALIVLYTLVLCEVDEGKTIVIDEPENYIGLRELQPLILLMEERVRETGGQILLISHNQEFINMLTDRGCCTRFYRENNGHTRIAAFNPDSELTAAEIVARGWEDDEQ